MYKLWLNFVKDVEGKASLQGCFMVTQVCLKKKKKKKKKIQ